MIRRTIAAYLLMVAPALAGGLTVEDPSVPLAPPGVMTHAAFFTLTNSGQEARHLIGVEAAGYKVAHIHASEIKDGIATMRAVDQLEIAAGTSVAFEHGGYHVMLMKPAGRLEMGETVELTLEFANGETVPVQAIVTPMAGGTHAHGS